MLSLPIPDRPGIGVPYAELRAPDGRSYLEIMQELGYRRYSRRHCGHLDPDLVAGARPRQNGWRGLFGQVNQSASHLRSNGVSVGDIFVFWGLFRRTEHDGQRLRFEGKPFHCIYGYLQVGEVLQAGEGETAPWAEGFPHFDSSYLGTNCRVYTAAEHLAGRPGVPGFGSFRFSDDLQLTDKGAGGLTAWTLPECFHPRNGGLSYHGAAERWSEPEQGRVRMKAVARGQEFVAPPSALTAAWATALIERHRAA